MSEIEVPPPPPFPHTVSLQKLIQTATAGGVVRTYGLPSNIAAWIHPGTPSREDESTARRTSRVARGYFPIGTNIAEGDRITWEGIVYYVEGVRDPAGLGVHLEADLQVQE